MTTDSNRTLDRIARRVPVPEPAYERLFRRRDKRDRNRRVSAAMLVIALALLSIAGLARAFGGSTRPASRPSPTSVGLGIFSRIGGWIVYGDQSGIWAYDPDHPDRSDLHVSSAVGTPIAWSPDGSQLLLSGQNGRSLEMLHADGTKTVVVRLGKGKHFGWFSDGPFSPDGSKVVFASIDDHFRSSGIYVVDSGGGTPSLLFRPHTGDPHVFGPAFSPDGSKIAYFEGSGDHDNTLRVMNADGSGSHLLLGDTGELKNYPGPANLAWFPNGRSLVFSVGYGPFMTYTVRANGSGNTLLMRGGRGYLSPDGSRISYTMDLATTVKLARADGTFVRDLRSPLNGNGPWNPATPR